MVVFIYVIHINNPKGEVYKQLLDLAFRICDTFVVVVRRDITTDDTTDQTLERLNPYLKEVQEQFEWPGTTTYAETEGQKPTARVYYYNADNDAKLILQEASNSLYDWRQPSLPEDLSFIKSGTEWLINTAHEKDCCIVTNDKEEVDIIMQIEGLETEIIPILI